MDDPKQGREELLHKTPKPKNALAAREEETLALWESEKTFEQSLEKDAPKGEYVFYDGPPFANGLPHYGHILASTIKDAIPRYRTMQGYRVSRQWGWDCHGLPVENLVERELGLKNKRDIEAYGIEKFNEAARVSIMKDVSDWKRIIPRLGRWADMAHDYKTMDTSYTESVWWAFKKLYDKGLIYEGFKSLHYCPHCGTTLSNFEVAQGYKDIDDIAVTVKLTLVGEPDTSLLIWTTTAWTLPGNTAAAVNQDFTYEKVKVGDEFLIAAEGKLDGEIVKKIKGSELVGRQYLPPFEYYATELHKHKTHAWRVYHAPYVTAEDGTGIVHLAPAFGAEDLLLAQKNKIPLIHHVTDEGKFVTTVTDFAGLNVKPKGNPRETDEKVAAFLEAKGLLFKKEKISHSYPHCWRCDTPLLNWAANSWFVKVSALKGKLLRENKKIIWVPGHIGEGRFNNGLESAPDWAISRSRFWGAPLPVWRHKKTKEIKVAGSINHVLDMAKRSGNRYFVMRHGQARSNVEDFKDYTGMPDNHLTDKGKHEALQTAIELKRQNIDLVIASPFVRTHDTAKIVLRELGLPDSALMLDERLRDGSGKDAAVRPRLGDFLFEVERRYSNKNILIVSHGCPIWTMQEIAKRLPMGAYGERFLVHTAHAQELPFTPFPHNANYELDLHRPYIDQLNTGEWERVPSVFDCWFESGAMPFASNHYPFNKTDFDPKCWFGFAPKGYPAEFIGEAIDQTRGWFYSLIVLGVALFGRAPYKNVITTGLVLASDGQKMSKRLKNYPDPLDVVEKYGADALRYYLLNSSIIRGEDLRFQEKGVDEVSKKVLQRLDNVRSFYDLYANETAAATNSANVLDRWILARLNQLITDATAGYESYQLDKATRPLGEFIDDLSNWYVRRSRDRFKDGDKSALATLRHVLHTLAQVMAPAMPFFADDLYRRVGGEESVHLSRWPAAGAGDATLVGGMERVRKFASVGLQLREKADIKLRQPLASFTVDAELSHELAEILKDEVNVKEIKMGKEPMLDTDITAKLKEEGTLRDLVRRVQEWRKEQGLVLSDRPDMALQVTAEERAVAEKYKQTIIEETGLKSLTYVSQDSN
ncbi:MAG: class I tRNA ligase family protein [Patescibacteria group bacterium]